MPDILSNNPASPPAASIAGIATAIGLVGWLDDLLDLARDRGDAPLARLVAQVMDDLGAAAGRG